MPQQQHPPQQQNQQIEYKMPDQQPQQQQHIQITQEMAQAAQQQNCVYIECAPLIEMQQDQNTFIPPSQINYNIQPQNHIPLGSYSLQAVTPVQVYNGSYTMPLQQMQPTNMLHNQVMFLFISELVSFNEDILCTICYAGYSVVPRLWTLVVL